MSIQSFTVQVVKRGLVTIPQGLRRMYNIQSGQEFTLVDLDGLFLLSPRPSQVDALADRIASELTARGENLESMLEALRQVRDEGK